MGKPNKFNVRANSAWKEADQELGQLRELIAKTPADSSHLARLVEYQDDAEMRLTLGKKTKDYRKARDVAGVALHSMEANIILPSRSESESSKSNEPSSKENLGEMIGPMFVAGTFFISLVAAGIVQLNREHKENHQEKVDQAKLPAIIAAVKQDGLNPIPESTYDDGNVYDGLDAANGTTIKLENCPVPLSVTFNASEDPATHIVNATDYTFERGGNEYTFQNEAGLIKMLQPLGETTCKALLALGPESNSNTDNTFTNNN